MTAILLERRTHGGTRAPDWSCSERYPVLVARSHRELHSSTSRNEVSGGKRDSGTGSSGHGHVSVKDCSATDDYVSRSRAAGHDYGASDVAGTVANTIEARAIAVQVRNLEPRTYYSFRASAVNNQGGSDPGPPCRRIRTPPPRPPSWVLAVADATYPDSSAAPEATYNPLPPRAVCSGLGACTVIWDEPYCNGAPIESYEVEAKMLGREVAQGAGLPMENVLERTSLGDKERVNSDLVEQNLAIAKGWRGRGESRGERKIPVEGIIVDGVTNGGNKLEELRIDNTDGGNSCKTASTLVSETVVFLHCEGKGRVAREVINTFTRKATSNARHVVIRGLTTGGEYAFRVAGVNVAGKGEQGPWTGSVCVVDNGGE